MKTAYALPIMAGLAAALSLPANAMQRREIETSEVESSVPEISLPRGHSITLHMNNGQYVQSVWVDDPALLGIATDKALCSSQANGGCGYASAVRLTQLNQSLNLPGVNFVDGNGSRSTLLTIGTTNRSGGNQSFYQFKITDTGTAETPMSLVAIVSDNAEPNEQPSSLLESQVLDPDRIRQGQELALSRGIADTDSEAWKALNDFLELTDSGTSVQEAISESQVSQRLLRELNRMGTQEIAEI